jgi:hypothetical protein
VVRVKSRTEVVRDFTSELLDSAQHPSQRIWRSSTSGTYLPFAHQQLPHLISRFVYEVRVTRRRGATRCITVMFCRDSAARASYAHCSATTCLVQPLAP